MIRAIKKNKAVLVDGSDGWSIVLYTKSLQVVFPGRAHMVGNQSMFLFLPLSLPLSNINKPYPWVRNNNNNNGSWVLIKELKPFHKQALT